MSFTYYRSVHFQDTDAAGVVYFSNILNMCHESYEASLAASGINIKEFFTNPPLAFPIVHAHVDFFHPIFCGDKLAIRLIPHKLGVNKFEITYEINSESLIVAKAVTRHVCIAVASRCKHDLSPEINQWLEENSQDTAENRRKSREAF